MWFGPLNIRTRAAGKPWLIKQDLNLEPRRCFCLFYYQVFTPLFGSHLVFHKMRAQTVAQVAKGPAHAQWPACVPSTHAWPRSLAPGCLGSLNLPKASSCWGAEGLLCSPCSCPQSPPHPLLGQVRTLRPR